MEEYGEDNGFPMGLLQGAAKLGDKKKKQNAQ
jgi:hypothetical protein